HLRVSHDDTRQTKKKRRINGHIWLRVPSDILTTKYRRYQRRGKPIHRKELTNHSVSSIVAQYQAEYRGLVEYYRLANDLHRLTWLRWIMNQSLNKTLATKLKLTAKQAREKYAATWTANGRTCKGLQVTVPREGKKPLIAKWGGISLKRNPHAILN